MRWFLGHFWQFLGFGLTLFGIFWLPKDLSDAGEAVQPWRRIVAMFDQNTALWVFACAATAYIFFVEARPVVAKWRENRRRGLKVHAEISWSSGLGVDVDGVRYFPNVAHLVVYNDSAIGKTIDGVRVRSGLLDARECIDKVTGNKVVALHSGEYAEFELGKIVAKRMFGRITPSLLMSEDDTLDAQHNVSAGSMTLKADGAPHMVLTMPGTPKEYRRPNPLEALSVVVSAKDQPPIQVRLIADVDKLTSPDGSSGSPIQAAVVI